MAGIRTRDLLLGAGLLGVYVLAGSFGLSLAFVNPSASPVWPPTGIALAALLLLGYRFWPVILLGAFVVNFMSGTGLFISSAIAVGNTLEALLGAHLVNRHARGCNAFTHPTDVFAFAVLAGLGAPIVSASIGVIALVAGGAAGAEEFAQVWVTWWLGDLAGALLVAPAIILWARDQRMEYNWRRGVEIILLMAVTAAAGLFVFGGPPSPGAWESPPSFICLPPLMWAAFRFGPRETISVTLIAVAIAIDGTVAGHGPFSHGTPNEALLLLQSFMATISIFALACASVVEERRQADEMRSQRLVHEEAARRRAEELNQARDQFLATISHELRSPLNDMLSWVVLARSERADAGLIQRALEVFARNIRLQIRLVEDLLDASHMNAGKFQLESQRVDLRSVVAAAIDDVRPAIEAAGLRLAQTLDAVSVQGDPDRLEQIVGNLLSNAIKFTPAGGEITVSLHAEGDEAVILVCDTGSGIDADLLPHLFQPFRQAGRASTRRHGGLGLGLSIVRHLVQAHGGSVSAEPGTGGLGTRMKVRMPLFREEG